MARVLFSETYTETPSFSESVLGAMLIVKSRPRDELESLVVRVERIVWRLVVEAEATVEALVASVVFVVFPGEGRITTAAMASTSVKAMVAATMTARREMPVIDLDVMTVLRRRPKQNLRVVEKSSSTARSL